MDKRIWISLIMGEVSGLGTFFYFFHQPMEMAAPIVGVVVTLFFLFIIE